MIINGKTVLTSPDSGTDVDVISNTSGNRLGVDAVLSVPAGGNKVILDDAAQLDAFGRLRVSEPQTLFDCTFEIDKQPLIFSESTSLGGLVTHDANRVSVQLSATTTLNSEAIFQSKQYFKYHPGKSQLITLSGSFNGAATDVRKRIGIYDANNGKFFQLLGSTLSVVLRSSVSGSVVDTVINQADWNLDKLDGTGVSGYTLDVTKQQIFIIDYQWLGSGRIRYGFGIGGKIIYCHEILNANISSTPYSKSGTLPVRTEIRNTGVLSSSMYLTCATVTSEGGWHPDGIVRSINIGTTSRSFGLLFSTLPMISLRKQAAYVNVPVEILGASFFANSSDDFLVSVVVNGTLTSPSWTNTAGICQKDTSATGITGGTTLATFYVRGGASAPSEKDFRFLKEGLNTILGSNLAGTSDIVSIVATNLTATANAYAAMDYKELV